MMMRQVHHICSPLCIRGLERMKTNPNSNPTCIHLYFRSSISLYCFSALYLSVPVPVHRASCAAGAHSAPWCTKHLSCAQPQTRLCSSITQVAEEDCCQETKFHGFAKRKKEEKYRCSAKLSSCIRYIQTVPDL